MPTRATTGPRPRQISDLVQDLQRARGREPDPKADKGKTEPSDRVGLGDRGRAVFLIGAGCSASAGIPLAAGVARTAVLRLAEAYGVTPATDEPLAALIALIDSKKVLEIYRPVDGQARWGDLYSYVFSAHMKHPNEQRDLISEMIEGQEYALNWAHACLGALVEKRFVHTILTTNFDQLVLQGVIRTGLVPVVADGLESLNRISPTPKRPQVVHLHGSMHTYELRNSYAALQETEHDRGLQVMMMSLLREASVLVVVGYAGGEEGIMTLLQYAAKALPRMVLYWIAFEDDFDLLSDRAKALLSTGENMFFILGQRADDFFNKVVGELGIGAPDWIRSPLAVLQRQSKITYDRQSSVDVKRLAEAYEDRVEHAAKHGVRADTVLDRATEDRSALRFKDAAAAIDSAPDYKANDDLLALHADSMFNDYKRNGGGDAALAIVVDEFKELIDRTGPSRPGDVITYIEALREQAERLEEDDPAVTALFAGVESLAETVQASLDRVQNPREWSLMSFYGAEAVQAQAEQARRNAEGTEYPDAEKARKARLEIARQHYAKALPGLSKTDATKARECKEGLAGALIGLSEYEKGGAGAASHLREAQTLFREVVESARINTPEEEYAGALANLADAIRAIRVKFHDEAHGSRAEEERFIRLALGVYESIGSSDSASRMRDLLEP